MRRLAVIALTLLTAACAPTEHALVGTWRAVLESPGGELPFALEIRRQADGLSAVAINGEEEAPFSSVTLPTAGEVVLSLDNPRFAGKAVLVNIFGSWCPNCNDEAPLLAEWHRRYAARGLEVVGLAYEFTGDRERDRRQVRRYAARHGIEFPLLLAGVSDKARAGETLPDLTAVIAYPTTVFVGRDGRGRKIHSGFTGPATGAHHDALVAELEAEIEGLLAPG